MTSNEFIFIVFYFTDSIYDTQQNHHITLYLASQRKIERDRVRSEKKKEFEKAREKEIARKLAVRMSSNKKYVRNPFMTSFHLMW